MDIERYRQRLVELEQDLVSRLGKQLATARETTDDQPDVGDRATVDGIRSEYYILAATDAEILDHVRDALARIDEGTYGLCVVDGGPIEEKRLDAVPWTPHCRKHQELLEDARGVRTPAL